jgi:putative addiction module component (TIGR02574 family)
VASDATAVLREALALSESERAGIAAELLASLPRPEGALEVDSDEWLREIDRRAGSVLAGETKLEDWDAVEKRILDKLSSE